MSGRLLKVEGAGNDFLLGIGSWADRLAADAGLVSRLCHRRRGIGADGTLAVIPITAASVRLSYRNADGSPARFCANGTRCAALAAHRLLEMPARLTVVTDWVDVPAEINGDRVQLTLPAPDPAERRTVDADGRSWTGIFVRVGIPHWLVTVDPTDEAVFTALAPGFRSHPDFGTEGANVSMVVTRRDRPPAIRTWELGVSEETLCCGSAVVAAGLIEMARNDSASVDLRAASGDLLTVAETGAGFTLTGPARLIAEIRPVDTL